MVFNFSTLKGLCLKSFEDIRPLSLKILLLVFLNFKGLNLGAMDDTSSVS